MKNTIWIVVFACLFLGACGDETPDKTEYKDGVVVVNQGQFLMGTGTLTFKARGSATPVQGIYGLNNEGAFLGNVAQSMIEHDGKNYIAINNGGKIVVTDDDDFTIMDTISGIFQSRFFTTDGNRLYVSSWGADGSSGKVQEVMSDNTLGGASYDLGGGPETMVIANDLLYVANSGGFLADSTLVIIDTKNDVVLKELIVGHNPEYMVKDKDDNIYLICNGITDWADPTLSTPGQLLKISGQEIEWTIELPNGSSRLAIDKEEGQLYFNMNGNIVKQSVNNTNLDNNIVLESTFGYALGFDEEEGNLYVGNANDFSSLGEVTVISRDGSVMETFQSGIIPSYFHFK